MLIISDVITVGFKIFIEKLSTTNQAMSGLLRFYERVSKSCLWIIFFIVSVGICGFSVSGLLTTIGLGGAALALASKDSLANFFGSVSLISDGVFKVGDTIKFGDDVEGIVEDIGLRSTRIRTYIKSLIIVPNSKLANEEIDNLSHIRGRFVSEKLFFDNAVTKNSEKIKNFLDELLESLQACARINSPAVSFFDFVKEGLQITVTYVVPQKNRADYFNIRSEVNKIILEHIQRSKLCLSDFSYRVIDDQIA